MFDIDFRRMIIAFLLGYITGGAVTATVVLALPWLWVIAKPALRAVTA